MSTRKEKLKRQVFEVDPAIYGGLKIFGHYDYTHAQRVLGTHRHHNAYEFCFLAKGTQVYEVEGHRFELKSGDIFFTRPGELHSSASTPEQRGILYWFVMDTFVAKKWLCFSQAEYQYIVKSLNATSTRHCKARKELKEYLNKAMVSLSYNKDPFVQARLKSALTSAIMSIVDSVKQAEAATEIPKDIAGCLDLIRSRSGYKAYSLAQLADKAGLSVSRFKVKFKQTTGFSPADYILREKIELACQVLKQTDDSVIAISAELGFSSSQYFASVFKRYIGITPSEYRNRESNI